MNPPRPSDLKEKPTGKSAMRSRFRRCLTHLSRCSCEMFSVTYVYFAMALMPGSLSKVVIVEGIADDASDVGLLDGRVLLCEIGRHSFEVEVLGDVAVLPEEVRRLF